MSLQVIFVDDDPAVLQLFKTLMERLGCKVQTLANSQEAVEQIEKEKFDAVFVDALMPPPDGFELAKIVRDSPVNSGTPVVMVTGFGSGEMVRKAFEAGVTFFLHKPFTQDNLSTLLLNLRVGKLKRRRRYARLPLRTGVTCRLGSSRHFKAMSITISEDGMLLEKSGGAAIGQQLALEFLLPQVSHPLKVRGRVVRRAAPDQIAVQFIAMKIADRKAIQAYTSRKIIV